MHYSLYQNFISVTTNVSYLFLHKTSSDTHHSLSHLKSPRSRLCHHKHWSGSHTCSYHRSSGPPNRACKLFINTNSKFNHFVLSFILYTDDDTCNVCVNLYFCLLALNLQLFPFVCVYIIHNFNFQN